MYERSRNAGAMVVGLLIGAAVVVLCVLTSI